ncbi:DUF6125 family protein [Chloroflexota bacterium]
MVMATLDDLQISTDMLVKLCSRSLYTLDGLWFSLLEKKYGLEAALDIDIEVWRRFSLIHGKRVLKTFKIKDDNPIRALITMLQIDPMMTIYAPQTVTLTDNKAVFRFLDCPPQKARKRDGRGEFPCKAVGTAIFTSYAEVVDPCVKLRCLTCPPDAHPPEYWCEWQYEI